MLELQITGWENGFKIISPKGGVVKIERKHAEVSPIKWAARILDNMSLTTILFETTPEEMKDILNFAADFDLGKAGKPKKRRRVLGYEKIRDSKGKFSHIYRKRWHTLKQEKTVFSLVALQDWHFRVNDFLDIFPKSNKYHNTRTDQRGHLPNPNNQKLKDFIKQQTES